MKKVILALVTLYLVSSGFSQNNKISIGLDAGVGLSSIRGNSMADNMSKKIGIFSGIDIDYKINDRFIVKSGLFYEKKGAKNEVTYTDKYGQEIGIRKFEFNFNYITMPLLISISKGSKINIYLDGGVFVGYLISQKKNYNDNLPDMQSDNTSNFKRLDFGLSLGFGIQIPVSQKINIVSGFYDNLGLLNISKLKVINDGSIRTNSFGIKVGMKINI